jgi:hypothetical protein
MKAVRRCLIGYGVVTTRDLMEHCYSKNTPSAARLAVETSR